MSAKKGGWFRTQKTVISRLYSNNFFFLRSHFQLRLSSNKLSMILDLLISLPLVLKNISNWHQLKKSIKFGNLILLSEMNEKSIFMKLYNVLQTFVICLLWYYFVKFDLGGVKRESLSKVFFSSFHSVVDWGQLKKYSGIISFPPSLLGMSIVIHIFSK